MLTPDGLLLTSANVAEDAGGASVTLATDDEIGADRHSDLAVVRVSSAALEPATLGDDPELRVGQLVIALASPVGCSGTVSVGVVGALVRSLESARA